MNSKKSKIAIVGGGSAALFLAAQLDADLYDIEIYEQKSSLGRKFLVAGYGGLNLSFNEPVSDMIAQYIPAEFMGKYIEAFPQENFRKWLESINIPTFIGTSNRIFPQKGIKPVEVLDAILARMAKNHVEIHTNHRWVGFEEDGLSFEHQDTIKTINADYFIWALGGASWKKTGSDGIWLNEFANAGIKTLAFQASNCAFGVDWGTSFLGINKGKEIKNITLSCGAKQKSGEVVITNFGLEGNAIYPLSHEIRKQLESNDGATVLIDLKPMWTEEKVLSKLSKLDPSLPRSKAIKQAFNFPNQMMNLLKKYVNREDFLLDKKLAQAIKNIPILITSIAALDEAISTVGGIGLEGVSAGLELQARPSHYVIGEMLDWDAPTGGYLLQGCWSMASYLAQQFNEKDIDE